MGFGKKLNGVNLVHNEDMEPMISVLLQQVSDFITVIYKAYYWYKAYYTIKLLQL